jgi:hypothetical protein
MKKIFLPKIHPNMEAKGVKRIIFIVAPSQEYISAAMRTEQALSLNIAERMAKARADRVDKEHLSKIFINCWNVFFFVFLLVSSNLSFIPIRIFLNLS